MEGLLFRMDRQRIIIKRNIVDIVRSPRDKKNREAHGNDCNQSCTCVLDPPRLLVVGFVLKYINC